MKKNRMKKTLAASGIVLSLAGAMVMSTITVSAAEQSAKWDGSGDVWRVKDDNGSYLKNVWFQDDVTGHWYMLGAGDGSVMYAGLITDQSTGCTYLLNVNHDGTYGRMVTANGAYNVNGRQLSVTFNQNHDGTFGAITSGLSGLRDAGVNETTLAAIPVAQTTPVSNQQSGNSTQQRTQTQVPDDLPDGGVMASDDEVQAYLERARQQGATIINSDEDRAAFDEAHKDIGDPNNMGSSHGVVIQ